MASWSALPFKELYLIPSKNGITKPKRVRGTGVRMINMGELFAHDRIGTIPLELAPATESEIKRFSLQPKDLLFARRSIILEGAGKCSIVTEIPSVTVFESSIIRLRLNPSLVNPFFYFYYFISEPGKARMQTIVKQLTIAGIRGSELAELAVPYPPLNNQNTIVSILSAYDNLIENNRRRIQLLEEMARAIYREWFVRFRFPGHEEVEMVGSELGEIPEEWKPVKLSEISDINRESIDAKNPPSIIAYVNISSVSPGQIDEIEYLEIQDAPSRAKRIVQHGDIIWSTVRPNRKSYSLILNPVDNMIVSTGFAVVSPKNVPYSFVYHALTTDEFVAYLTNHATGSAYPAVSTADFENAIVLLPSVDLLKSFHLLIEPIHLLKNNLLAQTVTLERIRTLLLPRLVSGEIDVSDLNIGVLTSNTHKTSKYEDEQSTLVQWQDGDEEDGSRK